MPRIPLAAALLLLMTTLLHGAAVARQEEQKPPPLTTTDGWINDAEISRRFTAGASALVEAGRAPEVAELCKGLSQKTCDLKLHDEPARTSAAGGHAGEAVSDTETLYARALQAVAVVGSLYTCSRCSELHTNAATGFFVTPEGALVTSYHVVNQPEHRALVAMTTDGRVFPITKVLAADEQADVAIVQVEAIDPQGKAARFETLPLAQQSRTGQAVRVIHHADTRHYTLTQGIVSRRYVDSQTGTKWITITADYARGSSGGPLLDDAGRVIGIVASTSSVYYDRDENGHAQNLQMVWKQCVPVENIRALLRAD